MLRLCCSSSKTMVSSMPRLVGGKTLQPSVRHSSSGGGGGAKASTNISSSPHYYGFYFVQIVGTTLALSVGTLGGTVGYSAVDPDFRKMVEENIPGSDQLLELVLGEKEPTSPVKPVPSKLKISSPVVITKPKVEETTPPPPAVLTTSESSASVLPAALEVPAPPMEVPAPPMEVSAPPVEEVPAPPAPMEVPAPAVEEAPAPAMKVLAPPVEEVTAQPVEVPAPPVEEVSAPPVEVVAPPVKEIPACNENDPADNFTPAAVDDTIAVDVVKTAQAEVSPIIEVASVEVVIETVDDSIKKNEASSPSVDILSPAGAADTPDPENTNLQVVLVELCQEMQEMVASAVSEYEASSEAVVTHINLMQKLLESNLTVKDDSAWNEMFAAAQAKSEKSKTAEVREKEAMAAIANVMESISAGRRNKVTSTNPELVVAEETANIAIYQLDQAKARRASVQSEARVLEEYRDLVEAGREQFHKEMASIMPDVKLGEKNGKLTEDELNMFITHAYKKVLFLQQEMAKQQTVEQERFKKALEKQRLETEALAMEQVEGELERQGRELLLEQEKKMAAIREEAISSSTEHLWG